MDFFTFHYPLLEQWKFIGQKHIIGPLNGNPLRPWLKLVQLMDVDPMLGAINGAYIETKVSGD